jgi:glutamate synthase (NADPH/NADH) small chain
MHFSRQHPSLLDAARRQFISAKDKDVIVIGGGDTGTDCVATAMRHGCRNLTQIEILPRPPEDRAEDNPWPEWPKVYKMDYGQEEAAARFGADLARTRRR